MKGKTQAKGNKAITEANQNALVKFPKSILRKAFDAIASDAKAESDHADSRSGAALSILQAAHDFREANPEATTETVVQGWRDNLGVLCMELATAGNRFAVLKPSKSDDKPATATFTGYGNNVVSIAKGVLEYEVNPNAVIDDDGEPSFKAVRRLIETKRQEARRSANPELAAFKDAIASADEAWSELRKGVVGFGLLPLAQQLRKAIRTMRDETLAGIEKAKAETARIEAEKAKARSAANEAAKKGEAVAA